MENPNLTAVSDLVSKENRPPVNNSSKAATVSDAFKQHLLAYDISKESLSDPVYLEECRKLFERAAKLEVRCDVRHIKFLEYAVKKEEARRAKDSTSDADLNTNVYARAIACTKACSPSATVVDVGHAVAEEVTFENGVAVKTNNPGGLCLWAKTCSAHYPEDIFPFAATYRQIELEFSFQNGILCGSNSFGFMVPWVIQHSIKHPKYSIPVAFMHQQVVKVVTFQNGEVLESKDIKNMCLWVKNISKKYPQEPIGFTTAYNGQELKMYFQGGVLVGSSMPEYIFPWVIAFSKAHPGSKIPVNFGSGKDAVTVAFQNGMLVGANKKGALGPLAMELSRIYTDFDIPVSSIDGEGRPKVFVFRNQCLIQGLDF